MLDLGVLIWVGINFIAGLFNRLSHSIAHFVVIIIVTIFAAAKHQQLSSIISFIGSNKIRYSLTYLAIFVFGYLFLTFLNTYLRSITAKDGSILKRILSAVFNGLSSFVVVYNLIYILITYWPEYFYLINNSRTYKYFSLLYGFIG